MFNKVYFEKYAILSLAWFVDKQLEPMLEDDENYESPDFQSEILDIGIEVVEAINSKQGEERFIVNEYFGKGVEAQNIIKEAEDRFGSKIKGKIINVNDVAVYGHSKGLVNFSNHLMYVQDKINLKTKKLNGNYKRFGENWLYVFTHSSLINEHDIKSVCDDWFEFTSDSFSLIILNCIDTIYAVSKDNIRSYELNDEQLRMLKVEALK
jgi:hypothetical protein